MKKYLTITVREQMQGMTVEKVLYDYLELTKKQVSRAKFRPDGICKNKVQCRVTEKVSMGDEICICLETDEIQSAQLVLAKIQGERLRILYEDEDLIFVDKPAGIRRVCTIVIAWQIRLLHIFRKEIFQSVYVQSADWIRKHPESFCLPKIRLQHRDCRNSVKRES